MRRSPSCTARPAARRWELRRSRSSLGGFRRMTYLRDLATHSVRGLLSTFPPPCQRAQGRPGACCTRGLACDLRKQTCTRAYRAAGAFRPSLRNGFTAYFVLSSENGSFASVARETNPADLAPAPRRPNHTTSPYASGAYVYRAIHVHRISPRVRDDRERPSSAVRREKLCD